jgi:hypothetical protein
VWVAGGQQQYMDEHPVAGTIESPVFLRKPISVFFIRNMIKLVYGILLLIFCFQGIRSYTL